MQISDATRTLVALQNIRGLGIRTLRSITDRIQDITQVSREHECLDQAIKRNRNALVKEITENLQFHLDAAEVIAQKSATHGVRILSFLDPQYPPYLRILDDAPMLLFCRGDVHLLKNPSTAAVIGTRSPTKVGVAIARRTTSLLVEHEYVIVSGLALGIDACAHQEALSRGGKTVAVLTETVKIYPRENESLANEIIDSGGLLLAEKPPESQVRASDFVQRDRLQSGLSVAVFAIEAGLKSGTQHAVRAAAKQGRLVYCPDTERLKDANLYEGHEAQIQGINEWLKSGDARPYSKSDYSNLMSEINARKAELTLRSSGFSIDSPIAE